MIFQRYWKSTHTVGKNICATSLTHRHTPHKSRMVGRLIEVFRVWSKSWNRKVKSWKYCCFLFLWNAASFKKNCCWIIVVVGVVAAVVVIDNNDDVESKILVRMMTMLLLYAAFKNKYSTKIFEFKSCLRTEQKTEIFFFDILKKE